MSYVLDGIKTEMQAQGDEFQVRAKCACGAEWFVTTRDLHEQQASLRFHYMNCPQAKAQGSWGGDHPGMS